MPFEYLHLCHHSRKELLILKLVLEKAFDKIEHKTMLNIVTAKGLEHTWLQLMKSLFNSGQSKGFLNGVPGKPFYCERGSGWGCSRQGDPL